MAQYIRLGSFNVQNLFERAKALNYEDHAKVDGILAKIGELQDLIAKTVYTETDKKEIVRLYTGELSEYIEVRENRGKLFSRKGQQIIGVKANGKGDDWDGEVVFRPDSFKAATRENTAQVIKDIRADILCIVEVEDRPTMKSFDAQMLGSRYPYDLLIDANDPRGIDVGLYSKFPFGTIRTHMFDKEGKSVIFSRDCLEVEILLPNQKSLHILCNHFKSRGYDADNTADKKRERQAKAVAKILETYDLEKDWVVVAGDFNDNPESSPLQPLLTVPSLYNVLELEFKDDPMKRWTYHFDKFEQIDFILVSKPLKECFHKAGVIRQGLFDLKKMTTASNGKVPVEKEYDSVKKWADAASDHGAVWAEFSL
jgi:endonuclease/exonuclease/phosphatase family metal-dependent hydrolase